MPPLTSNRPSENEVAMGAALGFVTQLLFDTSRKSFSIAAIAAQIVPAIRLHQIEFCYDSLGRPVGYATWAFLSEAVAGEMCTNPRRLLHPTEWNEGTELWIMDMVAPYGHLPGLAGQLKRGRFAEFGRVRGIRRRPEGRATRIVDIRIRRSDASDTALAETSVAE
jgi:cytolysin-activating lysine-acyltransferase